LQITAILDRPSNPIGSITLVVKHKGTRGAGNPHATCDVAGAGNGARRYFGATAPVPDPTRRRFPPSSAWELDSEPRDDVGAQLRSRAGQLRRCETVRRRPWQAPGSTQASRGCTRERRRPGAPAQAAGAPASCLRCAAPLATHRARSDIA
jgi:hypothetical protein